MIAFSAFALAAAPHASLDALVSANGRGAVVWKGDRLADAWPHLYQQLDPESDPTPDILVDTYFGVTDLDGAGTWGTAPSSYEMLDGTGIIHATQTVGPLELDTWAFAPMSLADSGLAMVARVRNPSRTDATSPFQLVSLHNWIAGGYETVAQADDERVTERGSNVAVHYRAPGADVGTCAEVYDTVVSGRRLAGDCGGGGSGIVVGFGWNVAALGPGAESWAGVLTTQKPDLDWMADRAPRDWLLDEIEWWTALHARGAPPPTLSGEEAAVYRQQIAFLKMAQVVEEGAPYGQIPASLQAAGPSVDFPHVWNITWVRDAAFSAVALARAGYVEEAADALRFLLQAGKSGAYADHLSDVPYAVSVCRTYGDGSEWTDDDGTGPNIEIDNFGLFLWALGEVVDAGGGGTLAAELGPAALDGVADALVYLIDPVSGLVVPDSSIWERHWNGNQKQFTWTSAQAVAGLRAAAAIAGHLDDPRAGSYAEAAGRVSAAIEAHLVDVDGVVASSVEELGAGIGYLDIAAAETFTLGIVDPATAGPSFAMWENWLTVPDGDGYKRNDDGGTYDEQEWAFADLRLAMALRHACQPDGAEVLEDRVTAMAAANHRVIPELYTASGADYAGPAPMLGFGAGLYVLGMHDRGVASLDCEPASADTGVAETEDCGCGGADSGVAVLLLPLLFRRR